MTNMQIEEILSNPDDFISELKAKVIDTQYQDWNSKDGLSVYEIAFIYFFDLMQSEINSLEDLINSPFQIKFKSINHSNRKKGIEKAIEKINFVDRTLYKKDELQNLLYGFIMEYFDKYKEVNYSDYSRIIIKEHPDLEIEDIDFVNNLIEKLTRRTAIKSFDEVNSLYHYLSFKSILPIIKHDLKNYRFLDVKNHSRDVKKLREQIQLNDVCLKGVELNIGSLPFKKYISTYSYYIQYLNDGSIKTIPYKQPLVRSLKYFEYKNKYIMNLNNSEIVINRPLTREKRIYEPIRDEIVNRLILNGTKLSNAKEIAGIIVQTYKELLKK